jgi:hypothetical protein
MVVEGSTPKRTIGYTEPLDMGLFENRIPQKK